MSIKPLHPSNEYVSLPGHIGGAPSEFMMVQRGSWWEGDLAYAAAAAGAMFG